MSAEAGLTEAEREARRRYDHTGFHGSAALIEDCVRAFAKGAEWGVAQERADRDEWARIAEERLQAEVAAKRALAEERAAWVAKIEALASRWECGPLPDAFHVKVCPDCNRASVVRALLPSDTTEVSQ